MASTQSHSMGHTSVASADSESPAVSPSHTRCRWSSSAGDPRGDSALQQSCEEIVENGGPGGSVQVIPRKKHSGGRVMLSGAVLKGYYNLSLDVAAEKLGISKTTLKGACRRLGLAKWPYKHQGPRRRREVSSGDTTTDIVSLKRLFHVVLGSTSEEDVVAAHSLPLVAQQPQAPRQPPAPVAFLAEPPPWISLESQMHSIEGACASTMDACNMRGERISYGLKIALSQCAAALSQGAAGRAASAELRIGKVAGQIGGLGVLDRDAGAVGVLSYPLGSETLLASMVGNGCLSGDTKYGQSALNEWQSALQHVDNKECGNALNEWQSAHQHAANKESALNQWVAALGELPSGSPGLDSGSTSAATLAASLGSGSLTAQAAALGSGSLTAQAAELGPGSLTVQAAALGSGSLTAQAAALGSGGFSSPQVSVSLSAMPGQPMGLSP